MVGTLIGRAVARQMGFAHPTPPQLASCRISLATGGEVPIAAGRLTGRRPIR